jgi:hypothetical protein
VDLPAAAGPAGSGAGNERLQGVWVRGRTSNAIERFRFLVWVKTSAAEEITAPGNVAQMVELYPDWENLRLPEFQLSPDFGRPTCLGTGLRRWPHTTFLV